MSRGVGQVLLTKILLDAQARAKEVVVDFRATERNRMMYVTLCLAGLREIDPAGDEPGGFLHDLSRVPEYPAYIEVIES
jgi:hypothetical protein